ncbi:hypothetical protein C1645_873799 [Glomus cerebriforme]|uniref:PX domain-containing protein n=1 Tax=Glomus cerebriforme TaxID=658196 RepID=A0A397T6F0_9GLOM|nr:hypothetical protein C1645_873799 [Glomus cerebriforme]
MAVVCRILNSSISAGSSIKYLITNGTWDSLSYKPVFANPSCKVHIPGWTTRVEMFGLGQYISYQIVCRYWTGDGCVNKVIIHKRYTDFYKLHQKLVKKYGCNVIPPFPPKQSEGRFEEEFIELRRVRLEIYLACLAKFYYEDLITFLDGSKKGTKIQTDGDRHLIQDRYTAAFRRYNNEKLLKSCLTSSSRRYKRFQVHFSTDVINNEKASKNPNSLQFMTTNSDIIAYYMNKRYFTSSSFISTTTTTTTTTTTLIPSTMTTITPLTSITPSIIIKKNSVDKKKIELAFKTFKQLIESKRDELSNLEKFSEFTNILINELIGSGIDNEMKSILWIYDQVGDDNNLLTFETKHLIILELLKYEQKKKAIIIMQKLLNDDNYIPESLIIHKLFEQFNDHDFNNNLVLIRNLFNTIIKKDIHQLEYLKLYTKMIEMECSTLNVDEAIIYFKEMKEKMGIKPDDVCYLFLIDGFARMDMMIEAEEYFNLMIQEKILPSIEIFTSLINHYLRLLDIGKCEQLFQIMKHYNIKPNITTYNVIIHNSVIKLDMETAIKFFNEIIESGIKPDIVTFSTLLKGYLNSGDIVKALQINKIAQDFGIEQNRNYAMLLIKVHIRNKDLENAEKVFSSITTFNVFDIKSLTLYLKMLLQQTRDKNSAYDLYKDCLNNFDNYKFRFPPDTYLFTTFISFFSQKYHDMSLAIELFEEMERREIKPSVVTYSILIDGFALNGQVDKAVEYFEKLKKDSIEPNIYTYTSLIKAWVQVYNIDKAKEVYNEMISKNIQPVSATLRAIQKLTSSSDIEQKALITQPPKSQKEAHYWGTKLWISKDIETVDRLFQSFVLSILNSIPFQNSDDEPNVKTFRYFINCYLFKYRDLTRALKVFQEMLKFNVKPDYVLYSCVIKGCCMLGHVQKSVQFLEMMESQNIIPDDYIYLNLIKGWKKSKRKKFRNKYNKIKFNRI